MHNQLVASPFEDDIERPPSVTWTVQCHKPVRYDVVVMPNLLDPANPALAEAGTHADTDRSATPRRFVVVDANVHSIYGDRLREYFTQRGIVYHLCVLRACESTKNLDSVRRIFGELDAFGIDRRREPIIAVGGGVLLDMVGLASSLYRRKTPYVRVPTTLIGLVDAGIGAKTGVNFGAHKNRVGTYEPPVAALLDRSFIVTQSSRELSNGLAEILKIALVKDSVLFDLLESYGTRLLDERLQGLTPAGESAAREVLRRAVQGMLEELQPNLWEQELERLVDYGHSFSPALEMAALPSLLHGEAVTVDMALTTLISFNRGLVTAAERDRVLAVMRELRLPIWHPACEPDLLYRALAETTRHRNGSQRLPLPSGIGSAKFVNDLGLDEVTDAALALVGYAEKVGAR
jgi:3-dehydroquinate synthetase